jgi:molybdopterin-binding protein
MWGSGLFDCGPQDYELMVKESIAVIPTQKISLVFRAFGFRGCLKPFNRLLQLFDLGNQLFPLQATLVKLTNLELRVATGFDVVDVISKVHGQSVDLCDGKVALAFRNATNVTILEPSNGL